MEDKTPTQLKSLSSISTPNCIRKSLSALCSSSLFSTIITLYALVLLYFPSLFFDIVFSPVFISTGILLLVLLRLGAVQRKENDSHSTQTPQESKNPIHPQQEEAHEQKQASPNTNSVESSPGSKLDSCLIYKDSDKNSELLSLSSNDFKVKRSDHKLYYSDSFREWNVRGPLEVIYEEYGEGEDDDNDEDDRNIVFNEKIERRVLDFDEKYPSSLSKYFPESDSDSSSEDGDFLVIGNWESSEGELYKWNEEEDREELIEIALDGKRRNCGDDDCHFGEEDNLIEIDIFPARN